MESRFEELKKMLQPLINKLSEYEELEIKGSWVIFKSEGQVLKETIERSRRDKAQQIHKNMALYLQDLNQNTEIEPIMPIETIGRTWEKKLDNVCEEIEAINPRIQSNAHVLEVYYKLGDLMAERGWNKEV
ncbi:4836_t:CDS:1 [Gigaspora margarita]|uniref:4836_t:CDS:1 n=1 Tax=Gigaspora margarita TaxID=4874 RepID=A0ABN7VMC6_GIGMA|nr:4836_t:CDS:1 [Gigaspora margarita]